MKQIFLIAQNGSEQSPYASLLFFVLIIVVFYFFMIRPQMKRQKEATKMRESLQKGDRVIIAGGIYGKIYEIHDTYFFVEIDTNVKIKVDKSAVVAAPENVPQQPK